MWRWKVEACMAAVRDALARASSALSISPCLLLKQRVHASGGEMDGGALVWGVAAEHVLQRNHCRSAQPRSGSQAGSSGVAAQSVP